MPPSEPSRAEALFTGVRGRGILRTSPFGHSRKSGRTEDIKRAGTVRPRPSTYDPHPRLGTFCTYVPGLENCVQHTIGNRGVGITLLPVRRGPLLGLL